MKAIRTFYIAAAVLIAVFDSPKELASQSSETLVPANGIVLRTARFWRGDDRTLLEGIVGLPIPTGSRTVDLAVSDSTGEILHSESWTDTLNSKLTELVALKATSATRLELLLSPGAYTVSVRSTQDGRAESATMLIRGFSKAPVLSDVVLSGNMRVLGENEDPLPFEVKRGRYAIERGARVTVLPSEPRLWYYLELYRQGGDSIAQLHFRVLPPNSETALVTVSRQVAVNTRGTVDAASVIVRGLPPGQYRLQVTARMGDREEVRESEFGMASWDAGPVIEDAPAALSETALMDRYFNLAVRPDADVNAMTEALTVSAPGDPVTDAAVAGLTTDAKRRFLARYWSRIPDPNGATQQHEILEEYSERVRYVTNMFTEQRGRSAVRTDRGRIYLRFGPPDARQQVQMGSNRSVDIWKYTLRRPVKFAFLDETGFSNFNLVYAVGEPTIQSLVDWADRVGRNEQDAIRTIINF